MKVHLGDTDEGIPMGVLRRGGRKIPNRIRVRPERLLLAKKTQMQVLAGGSAEGIRMKVLLGGEDWQIIILPAELGDMIRIIVHLGGKWRDDQEETRTKAHLGDLTTNASDEIRMMVQPSVEQNPNQEDRQARIKVLPGKDGTKTCGMAENGKIQDRI